MPKKPVFGRGADGAFEMMYRLFQHRIRLLANMQLFIDDLHLAFRHKQALNDMPRAHGLEDRSQAV
jgi:hypothetical protein